MGLGAPKKRSKLSQDPNNTAWSKSTTSFGHRILSSQGWKPGDYLGAENALHGEHYTAANASHIRVLLREDNLGIGANVGGKGSAETFGLSTLSGIFGRLNGKSDVEVEKQQSNLRDAELRTYQAQKHGYMNFVSGGLLVGDKIEELPDKGLAATTVDGEAPSADGGIKASKKRKAEIADSEAVSETSSMRKKRRSDRMADTAVSGAADVAGDLIPAPKKSKKQRKEKDAPRRKEATTSAASSASDSDSAEAAKPAAHEKDDKQAKRERKERRRAERAERRSRKAVGADKKAGLKQEKRARKEERRRRKEEKRCLKAEASDSAVPQDAAANGPTATSEEVISSGTSTPVQATLAFGGSRHAVRQRYIMQKRMASMDPRALNEILMIKAQV